MRGSSQGLPTPIHNDSSPAVQPDCAGWPGMALTPSLAAEANLLAPVVRLLHPWRKAKAMSRPHSASQVTLHHLLPKEA